MVLSVLINLRFRKSILNFFSQESGVFENSGTKEAWHSFAEIKGIGNVNEYFPFKFFASACIRAFTELMPLVSIA